MTRGTNKKFIEKFINLSKIQNIILLNIQNIYCKIYLAYLNSLISKNKYLRIILLKQSAIQHQKIKFAFSKCRGIYLPSLLLMHAYET